LAHLDMAQGIFAESADTSGSASVCAV